MNAVPTLNEHLGHVDEALKTLQANFQPTGLIDPYSGQVLTSLTDIEIRPLDHAQISSYSGVVDRPKFTGPSGIDWRQPVQLARLSETAGKISLFALTGWVLHKSVQTVLTQRGLADENGDIRYQHNEVNKTTDAGSSTGYMAMAVMLEKLAIAANITQGTVEEYTQIAHNSLRSLPTPFAKMPNSSNKKVEILYQIRNGSAYDRYAAAEDLEAGNAEQYEIILNQASDRAEPAKWEQAHEAPYGSDKVCGAIHHQVFANIWRHLIRSTANLEGLFPPARQASNVRSLADNLEQ